MKIFTHNYNQHSFSGPNKFTTQLFNYLTDHHGARLVYSPRSSDVEFCLIQQVTHKVKPMVLRLDGIWFNSDQDYNQQNKPIKTTYDNADAVIFQSNFNKKLTECWFGKHNNSYVIHNAADEDFINSELINNAYKKLNWPWDTDAEVWCCASLWRPHKRLQENIRYFLEFAPDNAVLGIAGKGVTINDVSFSANPRIHFFGELNYQQLLCLYKRSSTFIHLAYLDHCPNVVVDAQAAGCKIICSSTGGTKEIISNGTVVIEDDWDFSPIPLYKPPRLDFSKVSNIKLENRKLSMEYCAKQYYNVMKEIV